MPLPEAPLDAPAPPHAVRTASIASVGMAVPSATVDSDEVARRLGVEEGWIPKRTGVLRRHVAGPGERTSDLAAAAAADALARAGTAPSDVDLVLVATTTADELLPNAAPLVAAAVGAHRAGAMDVGAACTGFLSALDVAASQVEAGRADTVLVVGVDLMAGITDPGDRATAALFGDGAGAVVITAGDGGAIGPVVLGADADAGARHIRVEHADRLIRMDGHETFRHAVQRLSEATRAALDRAGVALGDIDLFVYHQANARILSAVGRQLGLEPDRVVDCIAEYGNTSAATVPIALHEARSSGLLRPGMRVLVGAFGAGFTWAAAVIDWEVPGA